MREISPAAIRDLALDIETELAKLARLEQAIAAVQAEIAADPERASLFYENLALKLHNFYTGCEKILCLVAVELNGGVPSGADWHKRLLERMGQAREGRAAVLEAETTRQLQEFLGFRHIVRNLYGFELDTQRVAALVANYPAVWAAVRRDVQRFVQWLRSLADHLAKLE
ncbi:hypothetical protein XM38_020460 [Halomicronema hongdechloris C2206]|uniref:HepT-like domain-containing protein n=1 Tax=Halomicronema hongdechloris C2206 TaxID=1641165 RepID=A0A1Z3HLE7_9CYAN|nr:hypothetical protein [Halomicronema hongdechloris]ASC71096.1 hypothetical protein XM38_020460 [Halomicronema hongdechloris C2206]